MNAAAEIDVMMTTVIIESRCVLASVQPPVASSLQQHVEHGVSFFGSRRQHAGVRPARTPPSVSRLVRKPIVAGWRAISARPCVLMVLGHVDEDHRMLVVEQKLPSARASSFCRSRSPPRNRRCRAAGSVLRPARGARIAWRTAMIASSCPIHGGWSRPPCESFGLPPP